MPTTSEAGSAQTLVVLGASNTALAVAGEMNFTINREAAATPTDAKGDASVPNMPTRQNVTCSVESLYVHSDAAQQRMITLMKTNGQISLEVHRAATAYMTATGTITALNLVHQDKEAATFSAEFDVDGDFSVV